MFLCTKLFMYQKMFLLFELGQNINQPFSAPLRVIHFLKKIFRFCLPFSGHHMLNSLYIFVLLKCFHYPKNSKNTWANCILTIKNIIITKIKINFPTYHEAVAGVIATLNPYVMYLLYKTVLVDNSA